MNGATLETFRVFVPALSWRGEFRWPEGRVQCAIGEAVETVVNDGILRGRGAFVLRIEGDHTPATSHHISVASVTPHFTCEQLGAITGLGVEGLNRKGVTTGG